MKTVSSPERNLSTDRMTMCISSKDVHSAKVILQRKNALQYKLQQIFVFVPAERPQVMLLLCVGHNVQRH